MPFKGQPISDDAVNPLARAICLRIREHREERGLSVNLLAQMAGLDEKAIRLIEKEERVPTIATVIRLTKAMELTLSEVVAEAEKAVADFRGSE